MDMERIKITNNYTTFFRYFRRTGMQWAVQQLWWGFEETCGSFRKEVFAWCPHKPIFLFTSKATYVSENVFKWYP